MELAHKYAVGTEIVAVGGDTFLNYFIYAGLLAEATVTFGDGRVLVQPCRDITARAPCEDEGQTHQRRHHRRKRVAFDGQDKGREAVEESIEHICIYPYRGFILTRLGM